MDINGDVVQTSDEPIILFQGDDVWVVARPADSDTVVCTFSTLDDCRENWAQSQISRYNCAGIFFGSRENLWWQTPEMALAAKAAAAFARNYSRRLGYSASMGAFGALQWSSDIGLTEVVAVAPQSIISPGARLKPAWKVPAKIYRDDILRSLEIRPSVIFDPHDYYDGWQAGQLGDRAERWVAPLAGHKVLMTLKDAGLLGKFMRMMFDGRLNGHEFRLLFRQARRSSTYYAEGLASYGRRRMKRRRMRDAA